MQTLQLLEEEKRALRWGGLAGIAGGIVFILIFVIVIVFVGTEVDDAEQAIERFPDVRAARTAENSLYLAVLVLWVPHFLALYRACRQPRLAPALFGSGLGLVGLAVLATGALPHVATLPISDRYHAAEATAEQQATLVLIWEASLAINDAILFAGLAILAVAHVLLGISMRSAPNVGPAYGWTSIVLGAAGFLGTVAALIDPASLAAVLSVFSAIIFHLLLGWKLYCWSNAT